jgi:predicted Zn-dependent protease
VTPALGAEICARNNGDTLIQGGVTAFGARYLLTLTASDCASGQTLAAEKAEIAGREAVISAMDGLIAKLRARLGESRRSIRRFDVPLLPEKTASLDALKVYSDAKWLFDRGRIAEAIPLAVHAAELDPTFPAAYTLLGVGYASLNDMTKSEQALDRAYALRPLMSERGRLQVEALRAQLVTQDYDAAIRALRLQTAIYPREAVAWANLANAEDFVGQSPGAVADGQRALALRPAGESAYVVLMRAQRHDGRLADAARTGELALRRGFDSDAVHRELLAVAAARGDAVGIEREEAWGRAAEAPKVWEMQAELALGQGRVRQARAIYDRLGRLLVARGSDDWGRPVEARLLATLGYGASAIGAMKPPTTGGESDRDYLWTLARVGDGAKAERAIAAMLRDKPDDTLLHAVYAPEIRASLAIRRGDGAAAVRDLAPAVPYANRDLDVQDLLGNAYLAAGDGARAAAAFRLNLSHRYWSPDSPLYPLARLGLARALSLQGDRAGAATAYRAFFADWKDADPDVPILLAAKAEFRRLTGNAGLNHGRRSRP